MVLVNGIKRTKQKKQLAQKGHDTQRKGAAFSKKIPPIPPSLPGLQGTDNWKCHTKEHQFLRF
jgi:hypothetical protein